MLLTLLLYIVLGILIFNCATGTFHMASWLALVCAIILAPCISFILTIILNVLFIILAGIFGFIGNICSYMRTVWKFIIGVAIFNFSIVSYQDFIECNLHTLFSEFVCLLAIGLFPVLFIPCIIRYGFKKYSSRKAAVIVTVLQGVVLHSLNYIIYSLLKTDTPYLSIIAVWDLIMTVVPYYILSDDPLIPKKIKPGYYQEEVQNVK